jgi:hypothetical protein
MGDLEWGALGGRTKCCVDHEFKRRKKVLKIFVIQIRQFPAHASEGLVDPFAYGIAPRVVAACHDLRYGIPAALFPASALVRCQIEAR